MSDSQTIITTEEKDNTADQHGEHVRTLFIVYFWLMVLMVATVAAYRLLHIGAFNVVLAMAIALVKASLVVWIFMHVKYSGKLVWVFATAAFLWLGIMLVLTMADYMSRSELPRSNTFTVESPFMRSMAEPAQGEEHAPEK